MDMLTSGHLYYTISSVLEDFTRKIYQWKTFSILILIYLEK